MWGVTNYPFIEGSLGAQQTAVPFQANTSKLWNANCTLLQPYNKPRKSCANIYVSLIYPKKIQTIYNNWKCFFLHIWDIPGGGIPKLTIFKTIHFTSRKDISDSSWLAFANHYKLLNYHRLRHNKSQPSVIVCFPKSFICCSSRQVVDSHIISQESFFSNVCVFQTLNLFRLFWPFSLRSGGSGKNGVRKLNETGRTQPVSYKLERESVSCKLERESAS